MKTALLRFGQIFTSTLLVLFGLCVNPANANAATTFDTETKLVPNPGARELLFGQDVAINNNTAAVSALLPPFNFQGGVYIYSRNGTNWSQTQLLTSGKPSTVGDQFGASIALDTGILVVGQPLMSVSNNTGEVYVYTNSGTAWVLQQKLVDTGAPAGNGFGDAVDVSGQTLVVGNPLSSVTAPNAGDISVFVRNGNTWTRQAKFQASDPSSNSLFGGAVAIDGNTIIAGAVDAAYIFVRNGNNWSQQIKLTDPNFPSGANFGGSVAIEGNLAAVTARAASSNSTSGAVFVYTRTGSTWALQQEIVAGDNESNSVFGLSVAIHNGEIVVGLPNKSVDGFADAGVVDIYQFNGSTWNLAQELAANDASSDADLGNSIDFGGAGIIASAPGVVDVGRAGQGAAYIFSSSQAPVEPIASANPNILFPPNHKLVPVRIVIANSNDFSSCKIVSVTSSEPQKPGKKTPPDFVITGDLTVLLRAERSGKNKAGRIYTITLSCTDLNGNTSSATVTVTVPHSRKK